MKKIYVRPNAPENGYPHIPEEFLNSSARSLLKKIKKSFPSVDLSQRVIDEVYGVLHSVDEVLMNELGGTYINETALRVLINVILERLVMSRMDAAYLDLANDAYS